MASLQPPPKVKVYKSPRSKVVRFGELLGISNDHKFILEEHPEFQSLPIREFSHFRQNKDVVFLSEINSLLYERS
jgi:hypothetical protein